MRVLVDVDGVCADLHASWLHRYNGDYNDHLIHSDITRWAIHEFVKPECGTKMYDYLSDPTLYEDTMEIWGALEGVEKLRTLGHEVVYVTSGFIFGKVQWLCKRKFSLATDYRWASDIIIAHDKSLIKGDMLVDDYPKNLDHCFDFQRILFDQAWNQESHYPRANGWGEVVAMVQQVSGIGR